MLTKLRLNLFDAQGLGQRLQDRAMLATLGMVPAAIHVFRPKTKLDRSGFSDARSWIMKRRTRWSRGEVECLAAFVSSLNHCRF